MRHDRFAERHSFNVLGFIQLLYDTTCLFTDFWVKPVWGLGWRAMFDSIINFLCWREKKRRRRSSSVHSKQSRHRHYKEIIALHRKQMKHENCGNWPVLNYIIVQWCCFLSVGAAPECRSWPRCPASARRRPSPSGWRPARDLGATPGRRTIRGTYFVGVIC